MSEGASSRPVPLGVVHDATSRYCYLRHPLLGLMVSVGCPVLPMANLPITAKAEFKIKYEILAPQSTCLGGMICCAQNGTVLND